MTTVYVSIGNSDDKLSQAEWATFHSTVDGLVRRAARVIHGAWTSGATDPWQNACWCADVATSPGEFGAQWLRRQLENAASAYRQDSIAWAEVPRTDFLGSGK